MQGVLPTNIGQMQDDQKNFDLEGDDVDDDYEDDEEDIDINNSQHISNRIDILDEAEALLIEESQKMDEAIKILNDPLALSICLKKQYDDAAGKKDQRASTQLVEESREPTLDSNCGYTLEPDDDFDPSISKQGSIDQHQIGAY